MKSKMLALSFLLTTASVESEPLVVYPRNAEKVQKGTDIYDYAEFIKVKKVGEILWEIIIKHQEQTCKNSPHNGLKHLPCPNPFFNQVAQGLFLEFSYGSPSSLWTPWGEIELPCSCRAAQGFGEKIFEEFQKRVTLELHEPMQKTEMGCRGSLYKIIAIDGVRLSNPVLRFRHYETYEHVRDAWIKLENRYKYSLYLARLSRLRF